MLALCQELANEAGTDIGVRQLAGLQIKNMINARDARLVQQKRERWIACDAPTKEAARNCFLQSLASPHKVVGRVAAQIIAEYGAIDVPSGQWPVLMDTMLGFVTRPDCPEVTKVSSLEALGYLCEIMEDVDAVSADVVNKILMTIVDGMQASRSDPIRMAATQALTNTLDFTEANFQVEAERNVLMQAICEATQCQDAGVRRAAYDCFVRVAELYYDLLPNYVATIFSLTTASIANDLEAEEVRISAMTFWSTISNVESDRRERLQEGETPPPLLHNLIETAAAPLTACVLVAMTKQPEEVDEDAWNISEAASACLEDASINIGKNIIPHVVPFIYQNIQDADWRKRDAAVSAFGHILSREESDHTKEIVTQGLPVILGLCRDPNERVRWSAIWTLGKICETHKECTDPSIEPIIQTFGSAMSDGNIAIVSKACYGIHSLALACEDADPLPTDPPSNIISPFYFKLVEELLKVAQRQDTEDGSFRAIAYETINALVEHSAEIDRPVNKAILQEAVNRLETTFTAQMEPKDRHDMQGSICTLIGQVCKKMNKVDMPVDAANADRIMHLLLAMLTEKGISGNDDAAYAVGAMADLIEENFERYVAHLKPILLRGLMDESDYSTCIIAAGLLGDICRAIKHRVCLPETQYCNEYVQCLIALCKSNVIDRSVKPHIISNFADLAMAAEGEFERYIPFVLPILVEAGQVVITPEMDEDTMDYINELRAGILEAYTGILQVRSFVYSFARLCSFVLVPRALFDTIDSRRSYLYTCLYMYAHSYTPPRPRSTKPLTHINININRACIPRVCKETWRGSWAHPWRSFSCWWRRTKRAQTR